MSEKEETAPAMDDIENEEEVSTGVSGDKKRETKGVSSVTDYVQEKVSSDDGKLQQAIGTLGSAKAATSAANVVIKEEDIKALVEDCEISRETAEALLRKHGGDVRAAMVYFAKGFDI